MTRTERIICFLSLGSWCAYKAYRSLQDTVRWDWLILLIIGIVALLLFTWITRKESAYRRGLRFPTLPGAIFVLTIVGLFLLQNNKHELRAGTLSFDQQKQKDSLTVLDHAKADKALQTWLIRRSPLLRPQFRQTSFHASRSFAHNP